MAAARVSPFRMDVERDDARTSPISSVVVAGRGAGSRAGQRLVCPHSPGIAPPGGRNWLFFLSMAAVGLTTIAAALTSPTGSVVCGTTLAAMVLTTVWDFDNGRKALAALAKASRYRPLVEELAPFCASEVDSPQALAGASAGQVVVRALTAYSFSRRSVPAAICRQGWHTARARCCRQNRQNRKKCYLRHSFGPKSIFRQFDRAGGCAGGFDASSGPFAMALVPPSSGHTYVY